MSQEILVVDDSRTVRTVVEWVFHGSPYVVRTAGTATEALRDARQRTPAAILVDYALPDQSGFDLCEEIRRDPALSNVPLLMLGGTWGPFDEARVTSCGADDFIYKPFKTDALIEKVTSVMGRSKQRPVMLTPAEPVAAAPAPQPAARVLPPLPGAGRPASAAQVRGTPAGALPKPPPIPGTPAPTPTPQPIRAPLASEVNRKPAPAPPEPIRAPVANQRTDEVTADVPQQASLSAPTPAVAMAPVAAPAPSPTPSAAQLPPVNAAPAQAATASADIDPALIEEIVRKHLPPIVKEVLAGLLRQTVGARVEQYATGKIDAFVERELPGLAESAIEAKLNELTDG